MLNTVARERRIEAMDLPWMFSKKESLGPWAMRQARAG
jgi:hypothetical protein